MRSIFLAIPAPSRGDWMWGRDLPLYGLMIAIGVITGLEVARRRWQARGGDPEDMSTLALVAVPAGLVGARLYHVVTDNQLYRGHWLDNPFDLDQSSPLAIWRGGLGIPGGLLFAFLASLWLLRRKGIRLGPAMDALAPGVPLAQAIGRLGNYFNQELYGRPTDLPWAVSIDPQFRPPEHPDSPTFHPTFLYEGLWNLGLMALLLWVDRHHRLRPGRLALLYVGGYATGRLWVEAMRSDTANTILGLRVNTWTSLIAMTAIAAILAVGGLRRRPGDDERAYTDGHRFDPELGIVAASADAAQADEAATPPEVGEPAGSTGHRPPGAAGSAGPAGDEASPAASAEGDGAVAVADQPPSQAGTGSAREETRDDPRSGPDHDGPGGAGDDQAAPGAGS